MAYQIALTFASKTGGYQLDPQIWTFYGFPLYYENESISLSTGQQVSMSLNVNPSSSSIYADVNGQIINYPNRFEYSGYNTIYNSSGIYSKYVTVIVTPEFEPFNTVYEPSFALEGTYYNLPTSAWSIGWAYMSIDDETINDYNVTAGYSPVTGVGGTATIPSMLAESGHTVYIQATRTVLWNISIGSAPFFADNGYKYIQLTEGNTYPNIQALNIKVYY